jgi:hypothetical protein
LPTLSAPVLFFELGVLSVAGAPVKRFILTSLSGASLVRADLAGIVVPFTFRFVGEALPSPDELATYLAARSEKHGPGSHWSDFIGRRRQPKDRKDLGLVEFCRPFETIELWFDPDPNDQLQLIWLLDHFRSHPGAASKLKLRLIDFDLIMADVEKRDWEVVPLVNVRADDIETASMCWQAYRAATPEACVDQLHRDLSAFPLLRPALLDLLQELPWSTSGLGVTEMRLLDLIGTGFMGTNMLFYLRGFRQRGVFSDMEIGSLLDGLAHGPRPAVAGLDDELRVLKTENHRRRLAAYQRSRLSLTEFGKAILAHKEDFSRHNPIDRWWGGTRLTNDNLWRWNPTLIKP